MAGTNAKNAWDSVLGKSGAKPRSVKRTGASSQNKRIWDELLKSNPASANDYGDTSSINWLFDEDADRFHQSYSGQANAGAAYNASKNTQQAIGGIYDRDAGGSILSSGVVPATQAANKQAQLAQKQLEEGRDYLSDPGYAAWQEIAGTAYANTNASDQNLLRARQGDASVLTDQRAIIDQLKKEGQNDNFWNRLWGTHSYTNQEEIDAAETEYKRSADLLKLYGMETIRNRKPQPGMIDYTEDDYYADLNTILHKAQGIDIPQEDYLETAKRVRGFVGNTAVEQAAFADPSGQWMDQYRGLYGQRMNTLDKYIDKYSGTAGTEYDFSAEDYTSYQRAYDRYMERQAEQEQKLNNYNATRAEGHQKLANNPGYAVDSRYVQGGDYWRLEDDGYTETVDYGSMMNDLVHASEVPGEIDKVIRKLDSVPNGYGARASAWADTIRYMSDADRKDFTYLYNTQGIEAAEQFLDSIRWNLDRQYTKSSLAELERKVRDGGALEKLFYAVGARGAKLLSELNGAASFIDAVAGTNKLNEYSPGFYYGQAANVIDSVNSGAIEDSVSGWYPDWLRINGKSLPTIGYNALTSAADSLANAALFGKGAAISMSFGAFDSSYQAGLESDKPLFDNLVDSTVDGAIEALTEYVSVEALFSDTLNPIGYLAKNMFSEASEEVTGDVLRLGYDVWAHGEANAINARIDELRVMGYDPQVARRQAIREWVSGLGETAVTSAFSGGVSALPGATTSYAENRSTGKAIQENAGDTGYQGLIDLAGTVELSGSGKKIYEALTRETAQDELTGVKNQQAQQNAEDMRMAQVAEELDTEDARAELTEEKNQQAQQRGKAKVSRAKLGQLYREVMQKLDEKAQDVLREFMSFDLAKELRQLGLPAQEATDLAGSVLRIQDGSFTVADMMAVSGSTEALDTLFAWTALAGAVDKAKGAVSKLAGMLQKNGSASEVTENGESITADGEEPVSMEAAQPEDEFDVKAAEIQAQAENLLASEGEASTLDGEEIEILGVEPAGGAESDGAPRVRIRTADGAERSAAAKDVAYGTKDAGVYQLAAYAGKYGRNADQMYNLRLSGQDVNEYARAFSRAAQTGSDGRNLSLLVTSGAVDVLTPGQAQAAYDIGRAARVQRSQAQQEAPGAKGANVRVGRLDVSQIERVSLNKQQRASVDAMGKLAKALGINVRFVESRADESGRYTTENGSYDPNTRTLTLDIHAGSNFIKDTRYAVMNTAGHELTHYIRQFADSELWDGYQDFVMDHLDGKMNLEKEIQKRMAQDSKLDRDGAIEEIVADASGEALSKITEAQLQELAQENPTLLQKIARFMKKWISNLKKQIELAFKGTEAKTEVARQMQDALDEMAEMWNGLLVEASRTANQTAQKANPAAAQTTAQTTQTKTKATQEAEKLFIPYAHIDQRDIFSVKEEHTELFCGEVEEARVCYAAAAEVLLDDLNVSVPGQKIYIRDSQGALSVTGQNRTTSDLLARMKDETGWTWDELRQTLTAFADMGDAEKGYPLVKNTIRNRRMEVYLHETLTRGYKTLDGTQLAPWREYVEAMAEYQGSKGAGLDAQPPKGAIPFEEYAFADMFADDSDVKYSVRDNSDEVKSIKQQISAKAAALNSMKPVVIVNVEIPTSNNPAAIRKWAVDQLRPTGYKVERKGFGVIEFGESRIKNSLNYLHEKGEIAAVTAIPQVLKRGIVAGEHVDHKYRGFPTITFAAPVEINGMRGNMAVVVKQESRNVYKTHRILMPDGSTFEYNNNAEPSTARGVARNGSYASPISSASTSIVAESPEDVNKKVTVGTRVYGDDTSAAPTITRVTSESIVAENPGDVKFSLRDAADDKAYAEEAKAHFGKTYSYNKAGYIVTDGSMLDFSGKHEGYDSGARSVDHREIWEVREPDDMSGTEAMIDFMAAGNIRLSPESGGFNLIVAPTKAQEYTLSNYISKFRGEVIVDIDNERGETIHSFEYNRGTHSTRVLNDLRAYFEDGTLPAAQSNLAQFLYQQRDPDQISDRELLATALQNVTQNADEWDNLRRYQKKIAALNEKQRMLEQTNARIAELKGKSDRASRDELIRMQNNARTLARSIDRADGELLKYEAMKPIKKLAERQREDYRQKLKERTDERMRKYKERLKQDMQDKIREVRAREAERGKQRLDKAVEHAREVGNRRVDRLKESEAKAKYRERIQKDVSTLREWLTQPTNKGHVPQFLRAPLADFLESLDFTSTRALRGGDATRADQKMLEKMDALRRALDNTREQQAAGMDSETAFRDYLDLPQGFVSEFDAAIADIKITLNQGGTDIPVNRMTAEQLKTLSNMIRTINTAVRKANSFLANRRYQTVSSAAQDTMRTLSKLGAKSARNAILEKAGGFLDWTNATPYYVFKRFGNGGKAVFEGLMDGWDRLAFNSRRLIDFANGCYTTEQVRAWSQELHEIKLDGVSVRMTTAQIMSLYCLNKRAQARGHLLGGGMRIEDIVTKGKTITQADNHILGAQDIANITKLLTAEQRAVADKMQEFMNTVCPEWGNEVSMQRFGYEAFGDEANYFPIESDSNNLKGVDENQQENSLFRLLNLSATKSTIKNANNALVVRDIFDVFSAHCTDMAKYNALALPILDALKWYNYVEKTNFEDGSLATESVQKALEKAYGKDAQKYIKNFLRDLNGVREGGRNDGLFNRMLSNYKIAAVAANLRVGLLQITSMPRAAYAIDPKYLAIGVAKNATLKNSRRAEANVGICLWKSLGFYDTNISRNVREMVKHDQSVGGRIKEKSLILAEKGDAWTMGVLYGAVEAEMADKRPGVAKGSKAYNEMVNARVREIVYQTQVVDSTMTRSDIMRDTGAKSSLATAFMSEPTLTMNMLADSIYEQRMKARESGKKLIAPSKKMVRAFAVNAVVLAFSSVMEAAFTAWRDDDEYETFAEKFDDSFIDTLLENMNPANNLPFVKDVAEALQGRSTARMDNTWAYTLGQGVTEVYKYLTGQSKNPAYNGIYKTLNGLSQMSGFAVGGLTREVVSLYNNLIAAPMGYTRIQTYADSAKDAADAILRAYAAGDNGMVTRYIDIAAKHGIEGDKLENAIKSTAGEAYKAGNIDELMLQDVLVQYAGKTEDEAYWAIQEMGYTGDANFSKYTRLKGALASGDSREANDAYAELIEHGVEEDNVVKQLSALYNSGEATSLLNLQMRSDRLYSSTLKLKADKQAHKDDFDGLITAIVNGSGIAAEISSLKAKGYTIKQCMSAINGAFGKSADVYRTLEKYNSQDAGVLLNRILDAYEALGLNRQEEIEWIDANWPKLD